MNSHPDVSVSSWCVTAVYYGATWQATQNSWLGATHTGQNRT